MKRNASIADGIAGLGSLALAVGSYGMATRDACSAEGGCRLPIWLTMCGLIGGMLITAQAKLFGAGPLGLTLAFLGPAVGTIAGLVTGHSNPTGFVITLVFTTLGVVEGKQGLTAYAARAREQAARAGMRPGVATVLSVQNTGTRVTAGPVTRFGVRVQPGDGTAPFTADVTLVVPRSQVPDPGDRYLIRYDPEDHSSIVLDERLPATLQAPPEQAPPEQSPPEQAPPEQSPDEQSPDGRPGEDLRRPVGHAPPAGDAPKEPAAVPAWGTPDPLREPARVDTAAHRLDDLVALLRSGALTEQEFQVRSAQLLDEDE